MNEETARRITGELQEFLRPYLGRKDYGNLRTSPKFPEKRDDNFGWILGYEGISGSSSMPGITTEDGRWGHSSVPGIVPPEFELADEREAVYWLENKILGIPEERKGQIKEWFTGRGLTADEFERRFETKLEQALTPEELDYARQLIR